MLRTKMDVGLQSDAESISTNVRVRVQAHAFRSGLGDAEGLTLRAAITSSSREPAHSNDGTQLLSIAAHPTGAHER